jgi:hypothetical protein
MADWKMVEIGKRLEGLVFAIIVGLGMCIAMWVGDTLYPLWLIVLMYLCTADEGD